MARNGIQLELPIPLSTVAERKAWIQSRLVGYAFRQAAREEKRRRAAAHRRKGRTAPRQQQLNLVMPESELPAANRATQGNHDGSW